jgi:hypothetical protein
LSSVSSAQNLIRVYACRLHNTTTSSSSIFDSSEDCCIIAVVLLDCLIDWNPGNTVGLQPFYVRRIKGFIQLSVGMNDATAISEVVQLLVIVRVYEACKTIGRIS